MDILMRLFPFHDLFEPPDDEPDCIEWAPYMDLASFLALVPSITERMSEEEEALVFNMDDVFVDKYMGLDASSAEQVAKALLLAPISVLRLHGMAVPANVNASRPTRANVRNLVRWNQLCTALGSIESIDTVYCFIVGHDASSIHCHLMPHLQHASSLTVCARQTAHPSRISEVTRLVAGLEANPSLKLLELKVPPRFYATVLPALQCNPAMDMVFLSSPMTAFDEMETATHDQAQALAEFLRRDLPFAVKLHGFNFSEDDCSTIICNGIAASGVEGFGLEGCFLGEDLTLLARSMLQSRLKSLAFLEFPQDELISLLRELGPGIASMSQLKEFVCEQPSVGVYSSVDLNDLVVRLVEGLAQCPRVELVKVAATAVTTNLEHALVNLISRKDSALHELLIFCPAIPGGVSDHECPDLLEAIKSNFSIRNIGLGSDCMHSHSLFEHCPWSSDLRKNIASVLRLNHAGRNYIVADPYNKHKGFALLEETNDSLDCLFLHLKENPSLCQREITADPRTNVVKAGPCKRASSPARGSDGRKRRKSSRHAKS